jgi:hypothetical protein
MKVTIVIETEDSNLQLLHAILADIICQTSREFPNNEILGTVILEGNNCGFDWTATVEE